MVKPANITNRSVSISGAGGNEKLAQVDVKFDGKRFNLLIGPGLLLRFEFKETKHNKLFKKLQSKIIRDKDFIKPDKQRALDALSIADTEMREMINKDRRDLIRREESDFKDFLDNLGTRQNKLKTMSKKLGLEVVKPHGEYYCKKCRGFRSGPDLTQTSPPKCTICQTPLRKKNIDRMDNEISSYLGGYWFEDYVANVLNSNGWVAWSLPSLMIYGASGASHQVDVLAIKNGSILIVECKTGEFSPSQVRTFLGKYYDVRCHKALAIAIGNIHPDGIKLIEKNPAITSCDKITSYRKLQKKISKI